MFCFYYCLLFVYMKSSCPFIGEWFKGYYQYIFAFAYPVWIFYLLFSFFLLVVYFIRVLSFFTVITVTGCGRGVDSGSGKECVDGGDGDSEQCEHCVGYRYEWVKGRTVNEDGGEDGVGGSERS